jgi:NAD(P)-dependent dehydrogenase (short-subunit alcohol dehydrogenase family)
MKNFQNKICVITGAGSGLGREFASQLYQAGALLALCDLDQTGLENTLLVTGDDGSRVKLFHVDVSDQAAMSQFALDVEFQMGPADMLINNAGICLIPQTFEETPDGQFKKVIDVNLWGAFYGIRAFLPQLKTRSEASIVNISSLAGMVGLYGHSAYSMSKSALRGLSESLQAELSGSQVHLLLVHPGGVRTNLIKNAPNLEDNKREKAHKNFTDMSFLTPEKTVTRIIKAVQKKKNRAIIGFDARLVLVIRTLFPRNFPKIARTIFSQANFKDDPVWKKDRK